MDLTDNIANRIKAVRKMAHPSRRAFARTTGIPNTTLQHWEGKGTLEIPKSSITKLLKGLLMFGIQCSYNWIMTGEGNPPMLLEDNQTSAASEKAIESNPLAVIVGDDIKDELHLFSKHNKNTMSYLVTDDAMEPRFITGEVVAGPCYFDDHEIKKLITLDCIVTIEGGDICLRKLLRGDIEGCYNLTSTNSNTLIDNANITNAVLISAAPVVWQRRSYTP